VARAGVLTEKLTDLCGESPPASWHEPDAQEVGVLMETVGLAGIESIRQGRPSREPRVAGAPLPLLRVARQRLSAVSAPPTAIVPSESAVVTVRARRHALLALPALPTVSTLSNPVCSLAGHGAADAIGAVARAARLCSGPAR
jgi:hypothetical protein